MSRNYGKQRGGRRGSSSRSSSRKTTSGWTWLFAGLCLGLLIAGFCYLKLHPTAASFGDELKSAVTARPHANAAKKIKTAALPPSKKIVVANKSPQPHFDFYTILPKVEVPVSNSESADKTKKTVTAAIDKQNAAENVVDRSEFSEESAEAEVDTADLGPPRKESAKEREVKVAETKQDMATKSSETKATSAKIIATYALHVASFAHYADADQLRAQLVLLGFDANVKSIKSKGASLTRVWLGPFASSADAIKMQHKLQDNNVKSVLAKMSEAAKA